LPWLNWVPAPTLETSVVAGSGTVSDTTLLQTALDQGAYQRTVRIVGALSITATVTVPSGTHLVASPGAKLVPTAAVTGSVLKNAGYGSTEGTSVGNDDIILEDLEIDGRKSVRGTATGHLIDFRGGPSDPCTNIEIRRPHLHDSPQLGMVFQNSQNVVVDVPHIHDNTRDGLTFGWNGSHIRVIAPHIHDCGDDLLAFNAEDLATTGHAMTDILVVSPDLHDQPGPFGSPLALRGVQRAKITNPLIRNTFAAGIFIGNFNTAPCDDVTITNPTIVNAGSSNTGGSGPAIEVNAGAAPYSTGGVANVSNVRIEGMDVRNARSHGVFLSGTSTAKIAGLRLSGRIACGSLYNQGRGVTAVAGYVEDLTADLDISGAQLGAARVAGTNVRRVRWSGRAVDNAVGTSTAALGFDAVEDLTVTNVRAYDTRATKLQTYGVDISNTTGELVVTDTDCVANLTGTVRVTQGAGATTQMIAGNAGFDPWSGTITTSSTLQTYVNGGVTTYYRDVALVFPVPFPTAVVPKVLANALNMVGAAVTVYTPSNTGCTLRVHAMRPDLAATDISWRLVP
jgi:hypothetical protein